MTTLVNTLLGTDISVDQLWEIVGINAVRTEREFNIGAGLSPAIDKLPEFVYVEPLAADQRGLRSLRRGDAEGDRLK